MTSVLWFRRDLRPADHLALAHAAGEGPVVALFVLDPALLRPAGAPRIAFLYRCLLALDESTGGRPGRAGRRPGRRGAGDGRRGRRPGGVCLLGRRPDPPLDATLPPAGEAAALARLDGFLAGPIDEYAALRDRPAADATTRLSPYLKYGCIHPRTVLARLGRSKSHERLGSELAWREFYADVLWHTPESARRSLQPSMAKMKLDTGERADERFHAWAHGGTGYPMVDAGMRQLLGEAWVHNRVRMIVTSFLVKDLHIDWTRGARWFLQHLVDGDLASNNHGWQWVAGTGTDQAPYFRVFNPVTQGKEHDPDGDDVRRWVPEVAGVAGGAVHEPWRLPGGVPAGYPQRIVDHAAERVEAISRYESLKSRP